MNKKTVLSIVVVIIVVLIGIFVVKPTPTENYIPPQSEHQDTVGSVTFDMVEEDEETSRSSVK